MNHRSQALLESSPHAWLQKLLGGAIILATFGVAGWFMWDASMTTARAMMAVGWGQAVQASTPAEFFLRCNLDLLRGCPSVFTSEWQRHIPMDTLRLILPIGFLLGILPMLIGPRARRKLIGQGRWASAKDLTGYLDGKGSGWYGVFQRRPLQVPPMERRTGTLIVGKPGGGKTSGYYQPNMLLDAKNGWGAIVFDLKWPDKDGLIEAVRYYSYFNRPVYQYTPFVSGSARIALLKGAEDTEEASNIADIIVPRGIASGGAEFYLNLERMLLAGLIWVEGLEGRYSLGNILDLLRRGREELSAYAQLRPHLLERIAAVLQTRADTQAGVVAGLAGRLSIFENAQLNTASLPGEGQVPWEKFFARPSLLYIGIPQEHLEGGKGTVLLWLVKRVLDREIHRAAAANNGVLPTLTSVYLDEFTAFGRLPGIEDNLKTMRSKGLAYHVSLQNLANGRSIYDKDSWDSIQGTFGQQVYFLERLAEEDRKWLSRTLGYETVAVLSRNTSKGWFSGGQTEMEREEARLLISAEEMREQRKGTGVILLDGKPPVQTYFPILPDQSHPLYPLYRRIRQVNPVSASSPDVAFQPVSPSDVPSPDPEPVTPAPVFSPATPPAVMPPVQESADPRKLAAYIHELTRLFPVFKRYYHKKTTTQIRFNLPPGYQPPPTAWLKEEWITISGSRQASITLTSKGLEVLDTAFTAALIRWCRVREWMQHQNMPNAHTVLMDRDQAKTVLSGFEKHFTPKGEQVLVEVSLDALGYKT